jgi:hypothetical protein
MSRFRRPEQPAAFNSALLTWVLWLGVVSAALGQGPVDSALRATVLDRQGRPIAGVELVLRSEDTGLEAAARTARDGSAVWMHLAPGDYLASVRMDSGRSSPITLGLGDFAEATIQLGTAPVPSPPGPSPELAEGEPDQDGDGLMSFSGLASTQNSLIVDGTEANQSLNSVPVGTGGEPLDDLASDAEADTRGSAGDGALGQARGRSAGASSSFAQGAVREFRMATRYSALTGHAGGGVMTAVTRSGTAQVHGSAEYVVRSSALAAADPLSVATSYSDGVVTTWSPKPQDMRQNAAVTLGGPVWPRRVRHIFYFYAFDLKLRNFPAISSPETASFFVLTPTQKALLGNRGVSSAATNAALNYLSSLTGTVPRSVTETIHFAKLDWHVKPKVTLGLQYNRLRWDRPAGATNAPVVARGRASLGNTSGAVDAVVARATTQLGGHVSNELRLQVSSDLQYERPQVNLPQEPAIGPGGYAPEVTIAPDGFLFGTPAALSQVAYPDERRYQAADTFTVAAGHHLLQLGVDVSSVHDQVATLPNATGTFRYDSSLVSGHAGGLVDWITDYTFNVHAYPNGGCPSIDADVHLPCFHSYTQSFGVQTVAFDTQEWAGFVQEHWRMAQALTIDAGVRYEYELLPFPQQPNAAVDAAFGAVGATSVFPEDRNNFGPRLAIAWAPARSGHTVVGVGYGGFFGRLPGSTIRSALANTALAGSTTHVRITPATVTGCPQVANQGFGYVCSYVAAPPAAVAATTSAMLFDRHFRLPMVQQASLTIEHRLFAETTLAATYLLNFDTQLEGSTDINIAPSTNAELFQLQGGTGDIGVQNGEIFLIPVYKQRVTTSFGPITDILSNVNATYNGLTVAFDHRARHGLALRANYTWSKAIDYGQSEGGAPRIDAQFDPKTVRYDKSLSSLNYPMSFRLAVAWERQLMTRERWLRGVGDGWSVAPIVLARSGRPYSYQIFGGTALAGGRDTINGSGGAIYLPTVGRNTLRLPPVMNVDLRLSRSITLPRAAHLRIAAEAFNLTNRRNLSSVEQRAFLVGVPGATTVGVTPLIYQDAAAIATEGLNTPAFGTPTAASTSLLRARQIQLSLRLEF